MRLHVPEIYGMLTRLVIEVVIEARKRAVILLFGAVTRLLLVGSLVGLLLLGLYPYVTIEIYVIGIDKRLHHLHLPVRRVLYGTHNLNFHYHRNVGIKFILALVSAFGRCA